jgi:hypothetical protein
MTQLRDYTERATLPYGGITRIRFQGSFSPHFEFVGTPNVSAYAKGNVG